MGIESASFLDGLNVANPGANDARSEGDDHLRLLKTVLKGTFPGMAGRAWRTQSKGAGYTLVATDNMSIIRATTAITLDLTAVAAIGNGFACVLEADGAITIDPAGSETVNGSSTLVLPAGAHAILSCDGSGWIASQLPRLGVGVSFSALGVTVTGILALSGVISPSQITANTNDYTPTGFSTAASIRLSTDARRNITGLAAGVSGRELTIHNVGTFPAVFTYEDAASTAANRFAFACTLGGGQSMDIVYDATSARWRAKNIPEPLGTIKDFGGSVVPAGFLPCDGAAISRSTYAALFNEIGTAWGVGDGSTTFNVPPPGRIKIGTGTPSIAEAVTASSANGFTVAANTRKWITGMPVVLSNLTGFTTSASAGPTYYAVRISSTNVRLATTLALAQNQAPDITISGTGTATLTHTGEARTLGEVGGEDSHAESSSESLAHVHTNVTTGNTAFGGRFAAGQDNSGSAPNTNSFGGNAAMNIHTPFKGVTEGIRYV